MDRYSLTISEEPDHVSWQVRQGRPPHLLVGSGEERTAAQGKQQGLELVRRLEELPDDTVIIDPTT